MEDIWEHGIGERAAKDRLVLYLFYGFGILEEHMNLILHKVSQNIFVSQYCDLRRYYYLELTAENPFCGVASSRCWPNAWH